MPTTSVMNTTTMVLSIESVVVAELTGVTLSLTHDVRDVSTKDSAGWREILEGRRSWNISCEAMYIPNGAWEILFAYWLNRTPITARMHSTVAGDEYYEGEAYFGSGTLGAPSSEDNCTFDVTFEGTGVLAAGATV